MLFLSIFLFGQNTSLPRLKTGSWTGNLQLNSTASLPFKLDISTQKSPSKYSVSLYNGKEKIQLDKIKIIDDSIHIEFLDFNSKLVLKQKGKKKMVGYWLNLNKGVNYKINCTLKYGYFKRFNNPKLYLSNIIPSDFDGRWETTFEPGTADAYKAVGIFSQNYNEIEGTFLTETGDYRFLEGNVVGDSLFLSCFDGSHAFLFTGKLANEKIIGNFYSGKHWQTNWEAVKNETFELKNPDSLTFKIDKQPFSFKLKDLNGADFIFPNNNYIDKVTIIQIMGTWCPNCMDETRYFKQLYNTYHPQGLEIISIGYETGNDFLEHASKINTLKNRLNLDFQFLVGGEANKALASDQFNMLNQIISFPTTIFIGKDGTIRKIHTGFNGPGTGTYYTDFVRETNLFIESLLKE